jgi:hypothetical protein
MHSFCGTAEAHHHAAMALVEECRAEVARISPKRAAGIEVSAEQMKQNYALMAGVCIKAPEALSTPRQLNNASVQVFIHVQTQTYSHNYAQRYANCR